MELGDQKVMISLSNISVAFDVKIALDFPFRFFPPNTGPQRGDVLQL